MQEVDGVEVGGDESTEPAPQTLQVPHPGYHRVAHNWETGFVGQCHVNPLSFVRIVKVLNQS